jgi:hypothetical protein
MALIRLDSASKEQYVERNAVSSARVKNATTTELVLNIGFKLDVDDTYANVKVILENPEFIPFYTALVDAPGITNTSIDPRNVAAIVQKGATTCEILMNDGRKLQSTVTASAAAAALGYLA